MTTSYDFLAHCPVNISRALIQTRTRLGLTPSELSALIDLMKAQLGDDVEDGESVRQWLQLYESRVGVLALTPEMLKEAREYLGLDQEQFGLVCGFKASEYRHQQISRLENGRRKITITICRLVRAYLTGYRPPDWPENEFVEL